MTTGVLLIHFGEPSRPDRSLAEDYLERIFYQNAVLEPAETDADARARAAELAQRRVSGLLEEYEAIGGSPLNAQARAQATTLESELRDRDAPVPVAVAFQFLEPTVTDVVRERFRDGWRDIVAMPIYPLCGPSTTLAALDDVREAIDGIGGVDMQLSSVSGWHRHPRYLRLRVNALRSYLADEGLTIDGDGTALCFSAHGTPQYYIERGSRYVRYVEEFCETVAGLLGVETYHLGYQNHENRNVAWTSPAIEEVVESLEADRVVVDPVSFMHEQSETLWELDIELAERVRDRGMGFHRTPIPHDHESVSTLFADLVEPFVTEVDPSMYQFRACACAAPAPAHCLNAPPD